MRSQISRKSREGGLWAARMALTPSDLSVARRRSQTLSGTADPNAPPSLWTQTPRSLKFLPLSQKPVSGLKTASRMPKGTVWESITLSPETTSTVVL